MFSLNYKIKDEIVIHGKKHTLNLAFDNVLRLYDVWEDLELSDIDKVYIALAMLLEVEEIEKIEEVLGFEAEFQDIYDVLMKILDKFISTGKNEVKVDRLGNPLPAKKTKPIYSFKHDASYIYASFVQAYQIDLLEEQGKLHWLKFQALLDGLPEGTKFAHVIDIRTRELPKGKGSKDERKALVELKKAYALPKGRVES